MSLYFRIKDLREDSDKTQKQVADDMYMHVTQYRRYESGESEVPLSFAIALAKYYNVSLDYIAGLTNEKTNVNTNDVTLSDLKFLKRFRTLSDIQKGRILERIDFIKENKL
jgi:transcriptional regulator with XRE-family HTH domain